MPRRDDPGEPIELEDARQDVIRGRVALSAAAAVALAVVIAARPGPALLLVMLPVGGVAAMSLTRRGTRSRLVAQLFLGLASLAAALAAIGAIGLSVAILVQGARGVDLGFGGVFILVGIPLGLGLGFLSLTLGSLALGGRRTRTRGADGLTYREPPAFP